ncbi:LuxR C-terminal-related transcriptional regulator [Acinetobacter schindleri]|nr:LuxR C-terminal-related transcriptional regulator [Acinetobacter schindleri]
MTCREIALCEYLINGYKPEEIAEQMQLSIQTIRTYMKKIYEKLEVNSQIELIHKLMNCTLQFQHIA